MYVNFFTVSLHCMQIKWHLRLLSAESNLPTGQRQTRNTSSGDLGKQTYGGEAIGQ